MYYTSLSPVEVIKLGISSLLFTLDGTFTAKLDVHYTYACSPLDVRISGELHSHKQHASCGLHVLKSTFYSVQH